MLDIPLNKALVAVKGSCRKCFFHKTENRVINGCDEIACEPHDRVDGKNVIFKLVDLSAKE